MDDSDNSADYNDGLVVCNETTNPKATAMGMELDMNEGDLEAEGSGNVSEADNNNRSVVCNKTTDPKAPNGTDAASSTETEEEPCE